jgi:hypothetical protein
MAAAFITCTTPRSMATEHASAWLRRRAKTLAAEDPIEEVTVRELRPRGRDSVWLVHVVTGSDENDDWEPLLRALVAELRRLGMRPTVVIDERRVPATAPLEVQRAA